MSFLINPFLSERNIIVSVENPLALSVANGTAAGSLVFQATVLAKLASGFYKRVDVNYDDTGYDGNTDGSYTLTGTLAPDAPITNPFNLTVSIVVWVIPAGYFWADLVDKARVTGGVDNLGRMVTAITGKTGANLIEKNANIQQRPSWNGEGSYFNTQSAMLQSGATSFFTRFSNGGQFTMYYVWKQNVVPTTHYGPIIDAINGASSVIGLELAVDHRIASSRVNNLVFIISRGVSGQLPINLVSSNDAVVQDAWNACKITYNGTTVVMSTSANGAAFTQVGSTTPAFAFSASNPPNLLTFGNLFTVGVSTGIKSYLKHVFFEDSLMSAPNQASMDAWAQAMCQENLQVREANVYLRVGQSNQAGRGLNSGIAPELDAGVMGALIYVPQPTPATSTPGSGSITSNSYWSGLDLGVNQTFENVATQHGMEMRFGYEMNEFNQNCWIIKYGVGGTPIFEQVTYNNWNLTTPTLYTQAFNLIGNGFDEITHVFRTNPIWRGLSIMQGETDAVLTGAGAVYKVNWQDVINAWIDAMVALGYTINKLRIYFWQITDVGGAAYDPTEFAAVKAAQAAFPTSYFTDHPSRTANVRGIETRTTDDIPLLDTQHYDSDGLDTMGEIEFEYFKIWALE